MTEQKRWFFQHWIWTTIIAPIIVLIGGTAIQLYCPIVFTSAWTGICWFWHWLGEPRILWNWVLIAVGLISIFGWWIVFEIYQYAKKRQVDVKKDWYEYTQDIFFGLLWKWQYNSDGSIYNLQPHCPHCEYLLDSNVDFRWRYDNQLMMKCPYCDKLTGNWNSEYPNRVYRAIRLHIENGSWKEHVEENKKLK